MSSAAERSSISVEDYLAGEEHSTVKHEYVAGEVFAMAGVYEDVDNLEYRSSTHYR